MESKKNNNFSAGKVLKSTFANIGRVIAALVMVGIITGCIVASVLTVYILRYINSDEQIRLEDATFNYTTIFYATDPATGEPKELQKLYGIENRTEVDYDQIPKHMEEALIAIEDKRFWEHQGVDWKRTFGAFVNMFVPIYKNNAGGSTITQQLIKNITGDDELRIERKVQEIFRALNLEKNYSKEQILAAYLNTVYFGNSCYGVQAAANVYFGKDVSELSVAESAAIIGITQYPGAYDPFVNPDKNRERQEDVLWAMWDQGKLTDEEYEQALNEPLEFKGAAHFQEVQQINSYFVDMVIEDVIADLVEEKGYTYQFAQRQLYSGGYRIYTTVDVEMQNYLEEFYSSAENFPPVTNEEYPQSACVITDLNGKILAVAGEIGEKTNNRSFNRATMALRQTGSAIKPLAAYLQAFENDIVTWSTKIEDSPITITENGQEISWPVNYYNSYLGDVTVDEAIQRSVNTIPVKLVKMVGERTVYDFLKQKVGCYNLVDKQVVNGQIMTDVTLSGMALGGLTHGITPLEMAGAYQIFGNGGLYTPPYSYTKVLDAKGDIILEKDTTPRRVITQETATILNKLMQRVTTGPYGTGRAAKFSSMPVAGKTGTSSEDYDQWFMGVTPYYVTAVWMGYDTPATIRYVGLTYPPPVAYKSIMGPIHEGLEVKDFPVWGQVEKAMYCTESGGLALDTCPTTAEGWYKSSNLPAECSEHSDVISSKDLTDDEDEDGSGRVRRVKDGDKTVIIFDD